MDIIKGITFNGKHSYRDFGLVLSSRNIGYPSKDKIIERVPFSNIEYDFSPLYSSQIFNNRTIVYKFNLQNHSEFRHDYHAFESNIMNWIYSTPSKSQLYDDVIPGMHFLAEPVIEPGAERIRVFGGILEITFTAYPFKISNDFVGNDIWDTFNFLEDYAAPTKFEVGGCGSKNKNVILYNPSINPVSPKIFVTGTITIRKNGITYTLNSGTYEDYNFILDRGENQLILEGKGNIEFKYRKEVL